MTHTITSTWLFFSSYNVLSPGKSSDGVGHSDYAPSQNLKTTEHEQHAYESSEQPAKKQRIPEESPVPECPISVADDKSAVASLLALSQVSTFKKDAGMPTCNFKISGSANCAAISKHAVGVLSHTALFLVKYIEK